MPAAFWVSSVCVCMCVSVSICVRCTCEPALTIYVFNIERDSIANKYDKLTRRQLTNPSSSLGLSWLSVAPCPTAVFARHFRAILSAVGALLIQWPIIICANLFASA